MGGASGRWQGCQRPRSCLNAASMASGRGAYPRRHTMAVLSVCRSPRCRVAACCPSSCPCCSPVARMRNRRNHPSRRRATCLCRHHAPGDRCHQPVATHLPGEADHPAQPGALTLLYPMGIPAGTPAWRDRQGRRHRVLGQRQAPGLEARPSTSPRSTSSCPRGVGSRRQIRLPHPDRRQPGADRDDPSMLNLQTISTVLYPAGYYARRIPVDMRVTYPQQLDRVHRPARGRRRATRSTTRTSRWTSWSIRRSTPDAIPGTSTSPRPAAKVPVKLGVVADEAKYLETKPEQVKVHQAMVVQALKLFGAQHYDHYQFLFSLSGQMGGNGLEHQRSSENGMGTDYFTGWNEKTGFDDLLPHGFTHSWNGKVPPPGRPVDAELQRADAGQPAVGVRGQTQYWGNVLAARSGCARYRPRSMRWRWSRRPTRTTAPAWPGATCRTPPTTRSSPRARLPATTR